MPVFFSCLNEEDHARQSYVFFILARYDSFAAQNIEKLLMVMNVHLCSGACGKGDDSGFDFLCSKLFVYECLRVDAPTFKDATNNIFRWGLIQLDRFQNHQALHVLLAALLLKA
jgi:hypothetical protein